MYLCDEQQKRLCVCVYLFLQSTHRCCYKLLLYFLRRMLVFYSTFVSFTYCVNKMMLMMMKNISDEQQKRLPQQIKLNIAIINRNVRQYKSKSAV